MTKMGRKSLLKTNLELWLNEELLSEGFYYTVNVGDTDAYSNDISRLVSVEDEDFQSYQVWQSPFKNWVYESGINSPASGISPPIVASGVTVDGTFYPDTTTGTYEHFIDYPNGRVVFTSSIPSNSVVQCSFSYKDFMVDFADRYNNENMPLLIETSYKDNPAQTGVEIYPSEQSRTLPLILIDLNKRQNSGYELGSKSLVSEFAGVFHIWTREPYHKDLMDDFFSERQRSVIKGVNFNKAPFPLLSKGRRNPSWKTYKTYAQRWHDYFWRNIYLDEVSTEEMPKLFEVERLGARFRILIYPNF